MNGTTLAKTQDVKKDAAYKAITVAIGVLVAVVIAVTLWIRAPRHSDPPAPPHAPQSLLQKAEHVFKAVTEVYQVVQGR